MQNRPPVDPSLPLEALDFQITDLADARHALEELPPGVTEVQANQPGFWEQRRRRPLPTDRAISGTTIDWVVALPPSLRPHQLCEAFPRVANELAHLWPDDVGCAAYLETLVAPRRRGRRGFPAPVLEELKRLRSHRLELRLGGAQPR